MQQRSTNICDKAELFIDTLYAPFGSLRGREQNVAEKRQGQNH